MVDRYDEREARCPVLGHEIRFHYCRTQGEGQLCRHILNCWFQSIPIEPFLKEHHAQEELRALWAPPEPKAVTLVDLIRKARQTQNDEP